MAKIPPGVGPKSPQVVALFGATGDLARRKLLPGLFRLSSAGFIPDCRIIGVSLDDMKPEEFRVFAREALREFGIGDVELRPGKANQAVWHQRKPRENPIIAHSKSGFSARSTFALNHLS